MRSSPMSFQLVAHRMATSKNEGGPWDYFLSHKQGESGRTAMAICRDLEKAGKTVWLDVNMDNCDTSAMMEGVEHSHNFVLVLSDGYFKSDFCVMEVRQARKLGKHIVLCHLENLNVGAALQALPAEFTSIGEHTSIPLIVSNANFRRVSVDQILQKSTEPVVAMMQHASIAAPRPVAQARPAESKPSKQAISKMFGKVGGSLDAALTAARLDWSRKGLDDEDANVVAYVIKFNAVLTFLSLWGNNIGDVGAAAIGEALKRNAALNSYE